VTLGVSSLDGAGGDVRDAVQLMQAGAVDYLMASDEPGLLLTAVATALAEVREATERDSAAARARRSIADLSAREREVLHGLLIGVTSKNIGKALGISPRTVEMHRAHVMQRLGVHTLLEVVLLTTAAGLKPSWPPGESS
jgi:FixJ family two-component response regulator